MTQKTWRRWSGIVRNVLGGAARRRNDSPHRWHRPQVELLESRLTPAVPSVTNPTASSITAFEALLGGTVADDGGEAITERGILLAPATESGSLVRFSDIPGSIEFHDAEATLGTFDELASFLQPNTAYRYVAF